MTGRPRILVVGGGITGLAAAWEAGGHDVDVVLAEADAQLGGKIRTEHVDGLLIEHGPDSFVSYRPAVLELIAELGRSEEVIGVGPDRRVDLRIGGRLLPLPDGMGTVLPTRLGPLVSTRALSPSQKGRAALDLVLPRRLDQADAAVGQLIRARLGDGVVRNLAQPLVGGIYGASVDDLSIDAVLPTLRESERRHRSLILASLAQGRAARRAASAQGGRGPSSPFRTLSGGLGSLTARLAQELAARGADLRTGVEVVSLRRTESGTEAVLADGRTELVDGVVLAGGARPSARLLGDHAPEAATALSEIPHGSTSVVTLAYPDDAFPAPLRSQGWLEGTPGRAAPAPLSGVTVSSAKWPGRAPQGVTLLRAYVPDLAGAIADAEDAALVDAVAAHVRAVTGVRGAPTLRRITRWRQVMPKYTLGHLDRVARVERALASQPSWQVAGSALRGVGLPDCVADGRRATRAVLAALASTG